MSSLSFQRAAFARALAENITPFNRDLLHEMQADLDHQTELHADQKQKITNARHLITRITGEKLAGGSFSVPQGFSSQSEAEVGMIQLINSLQNKSSAPHNSHIRLAANAVKRVMGSDELYSQTIDQMMDACDKGGVNIVIGPNGAHVPHNARVAEQRNGRKGGRSHG